MDMALHGSLAPLERESGFHGIVISLKSLGKTTEFRHALFENLLEPGIEMLALPFAEHGRKALYQIIGLGNHRISLEQLRMIGLLPIEQLLFRKCHPTSDLLSSWWAALFDLVLCYDVLY